MATLSHAFFLLPWMQILSAIHVLRCALPLWKRLGAYVWQFASSTIKDLQYDDETITAYESHIPGLLAFENDDTELVATPAATIDSDATLQITELDNNRNDVEPQLSTTTVSSAIELIDLMRSDEVSCQFALRDGRRITTDKRAIVELLELIDPEDDDDDYHSCSDSDSSVLPSDLEEGVILPTPSIAPILCMPPIHCFLGLV